MSYEVRPKSKRVDFYGNLILDFIRSKNGKAFPLRECAEATGLHYNTIQRRITGFLEKGKIKCVGYRSYEVVES